MTDNETTTDQQRQTPTPAAVANAIKNIKPDASADAEAKVKEARDEAARYRQRTRDAEATAQQANTELAEARAEIARMQLRLDHGDLFDDETLALCTETTPEGIAEWGAGIVKLAEKIRANPKQNKEPDKQYPPDDLGAFVRPSPVPNPIRRKDNNLAKAIRGR
ncbi:hypothetical protein [uncultured Bifidobacterium sp.]|uniref:hypothetical protein n=1 Tax=uncultured Bifidobacterium sp. TaxID=165187 RepID=UPI00258553BF|nr:hypothetical protein [uncultured Bifidobacterium sp.]